MGVASTAKGGPGFNSVGSKMKLSVTSDATKDKGSYSKGQAFCPLHLLIFSCCVQR
jgi:hypothetical protein